MPPHPHPDRLRAFIYAMAEYADEMTVALNGNRMAASMPEPGMDG